MKIAFTSKGNGWDDMIDSRFGRTEYLVILDEDTGELTAYDNRAVKSVVHGAGPQTAQKLSELGADVLITGNGPGGNALSILNRMDLDIFFGAGDMTIRKAYQAYKNNMLIQGGKNA